MVAVKMGNSQHRPHAPSPMLLFTGSQFKRAIVKVY